ncbi:MAG: hypothetical protein JNL34_06450 [Anaerolineae bacterium]|nr:hypothetical protein [Anaerolineae bacterium]
MNYTVSTYRPLYLALLLVLCGLFGSAAVSTQPAPVPWEPWAAHDPGQLDDDGTGAVFAMSEADGRPALEITPGGASEETKLAFPFSGGDLQAWANAAALQMDVYLPEANTLNPDGFFLGLAATTPQWAWVDGTFGAPDGGSGWATVTFPLSDALRSADPNGAYTLYLSFFEQASKTPLTQPFYVGEISLMGVETSPGAADYAQEAAALLELDDAALIDTVARQTFDYFWLEANLDNGLIPDRSTAASPASIAAVGFGLAALPIGVERGWITADEGRERATVTLNTFLSGGVQGERGFYYHFVDMQTGERMWGSELSSIDTALLAAGALVAGQYFGGEVQLAANALSEHIEWDWMTDGGEFVTMGWTPEGGFLGAQWDHFDESQILYALALGSPTHPLPASAWQNWRRPLRSDDESIYLPGDPLFVYQYPQAFLNLRGLEDAFANYWNNTVRACERHAAYIEDNADVFATYGHGAWGLSASDGPGGYRAYGATDVNNDGTLAPYASAACLPFTPDIALESLRALLRTYGERVWREYGFVSAVNEDAGWYSRDHIGIDQGDILLMLANAQDGLVWELFMSHPSIQAALNAMGFVASSGDYAVTPAYWAARMGE